MDIIAILDSGVDMNGKQVLSYGVYGDYLSRKSEQLSNIVRMKIYQIRYLMKTNTIQSMT